MQPFFSTSCSPSCEEDSSPQTSTNTHTPLTCHMSYILPSLSSICMTAHSQQRIRRRMTFFFLSFSLLFLNCCLFAHVIANAKAEQHDWVYGEIYSRHEQSQSERNEKLQPSFLPFSLFFLVPSSFFSRIPPSTLDFHMYLASKFLCPHIFFWNLVPLSFLSSSFS